LRCYDRWPMHGVADFHTEFWSALANAVAGHPTPAFTDHDVRRLLRRAPSFVTQSGDRDSGIRYRPDHQELRSHLLSHDPELEREIEQRISQTLADRTPQTAGGKADWLAASRYVLDHLAAHAAAGRGPDYLFRDACFLIAANPATLLA
jgi:hypothetical protein